MLNHITIMGRLTRDPELRRTGSGVAVASFAIACDRDIANKESGERETDFVAKHFQKGSMAVVDGRLQVRAWTDKDGNKRRTAEIVANNIYFGDSKKEESAHSDQYTGFVKNQPANDFQVLDGPDEQLPF